MIPEPGGPKRLLPERIYRFFELLVLASLAVVTGFLVLLSVVELGWRIASDLLSAPRLLLQPEELLELFGFVLLVLIGIELLETLKAYFRENVVHVEVVLEVALIAIARKVIVLDLSKYDGLSVIAIAVLVLALSVAFHLERRARA